jgi:hypothetical protein
VATHYRPDAILTPASSVRHQADLDRINTLLEAEGLGRPLGSPTVQLRNMDVVPTAVDPAVVRNALRRIKQRGEQVDLCDLDHRYTPGTEGLTYGAAGCQTGHGVGPWLSAPRWELDPEPAWLPASDPARRPVIALLDTGVAKRHPWFPKPDEDDPFVTTWKPTEPVTDTENRRFHGHGTFNAGLIRFLARDARVLSMRVMGDDGTVLESNLIEALDELADRKAAGQRFDAICIPFGRYAHDDDDDLEAVRKALRQLAPVPIVASAGNDGLERPMFPAAFATDSTMSVVSVGSGESADDRAPYSNYGVWVQQWRRGTHALSAIAMPKGWPYGHRYRYGWWSGTSFAAIKYASELVGHQVTVLPIP